MTESAVGPSNIVLLLTTSSSQAEAESIAKNLVQQKLAVCVSVGAPERSVYFWQNQICEELEWPLKIKTTANRLEAIHQWFSEEHSFDVPEFIVVSASYSTKSYENWINEYLN